MATASLLSALKSVNRACEESARFRDRRDREGMEALAVEFYQRAVVDMVEKDFDLFERN